MLDLHTSHHKQWWFNHVDVLVVYVRVSHTALETLIIKTVGWNRYAQNLQIDDSGIHATIPATLCMVGYPSRVLNSFIHPNYKQWWVKISKTIRLRFRRDLTVEYVNVEQTQLEYFFVYISPNKKSFDYTAHTDLILSLIFILFYSLM